MPLALFAAGALRGPNGPVGSAVGAGWRQHRSLAQIAGSARYRGSSRDVPLLVGALVANGFLARSPGTVGGTATVPREQVVTMNRWPSRRSPGVRAPTSCCPAGCSAAATRGPRDRLRWRSRIDRAAWSLRFGPRAARPDDTERAIHGSAVYAGSVGYMERAIVVQLPTVAADCPVWQRIDGGRYQLTADLLLVRHVTARR